MPPKPGVVLVHSKRFDENYGDFAMKSSNNVVFHFPKVLLEYASPFFRDMFSIGGYSELPVDHNQPLDMEEDSKTLGNLLQCIDPVRNMPPIDATTISKLLRAAHKYQIEKIIKWFAQGARTGHTCTVDGHQSLILTQPMLVLSLAEQYNLIELARMALRQLILEPASTLLMDDMNISFKLFLHLNRLRKQRIDWYLASFQRLTPHLGTGDLAIWTRDVHNTPRRSCVDDSISDFKRRKECFSNGHETCKRCRRTMAPTANWEEAEGYRHALIKIAEWEKGAKELEIQLPPLPKGVSGG